MASGGVSISSVSSTPKKGKGRTIPRARSVPHRGVFTNTVVFSVIHYLGIIASLTTFVVYFIQPSNLATKVLTACLIFSGISWFIAFLKRRQTHCPLCKGTPLINTGALPHQKAVKWFPFNHGVTSTLSIILLQKFRCMYCGTFFDMLKPQANRQSNKYEADYTPYTSYKQDDQ
ncbi:MAG: hypothetical protein ACSHX9_12940 [Luteolibacter sp.]